MEYFHVQRTLFVLRDKEDMQKIPKQERTEKLGINQKNRFQTIDRENSLRLTKGSYYNQGKWVNEPEYGEGLYYSEYYDDDLDLVTSDESSGESECESHNDPVLHQMFFAKHKIILVSLEKLSTLINAFTVCKSCNIPKISFR